MIDKECPNTIIVYTDGSCFPNPKGKGGWAFYCVFRGNTAIRYGNYDKVTDKGDPVTNNLVELEAIKHALDYIPAGSEFTSPIVIFTDSKYSKNALTEWGWKWRVMGWKTGNGSDVKNKETVEQCLKLLEMHKEHREVEIRWVKGHAGIPENELVDQHAGYARVNQLTNWRVIDSKNLDSIDDAS